MEAALEGKPEIEPLPTCSSSGYRLSSAIGADGSNTSLNTSGTIETSTCEMSSTVAIVTSSKETKKRKTEANEKVHTFFRDDTLHIDHDILYNHLSLLTITNSDDLRRRCTIINEC